MKVVFNSLVHEQLKPSASLKKYCPLPGNQLQMNTSPAWAVCWSACGILNAQIHNWTNVETITENTYSPAFVYQVVKPADDYQCLAGTDLLSVLETMKKRGSRRYVEYLEFCPDASPNDVVGGDQIKTITDFLKLFEYSTDPYEKIVSVKKAISEGLPVVTGMKCPPSFQKADSFWQPREKSDYPWDGQALCVVGYDDEKYGGAFEVLNSWGSEWGVKGFTWITYHDFIDFTKYAYEIMMLNHEDRAKTLAGEIAFKLDDYSSMPLETTSNGILKTIQAYRTGTHFRILINNENPGFVYAFGTDSSNELFPIFPVSENLSPAYTYRNTPMAIPGEDSYIALTGSEGKNYLFILYSKEAVDIHAMFGKLKRKPGAMLGNIYQQLGDYIPGQNQLFSSPMSTRFTAADTTTSAVLLVVEIDQVNQHW